MIVTWLKRGLAALLLLVLSLVLYLVAIGWDVIDAIACWWADVRIQRIQGWRFLLGFSASGRAGDRVFMGYRQIYLGRWFVEWRV